MEIHWSVLIVLLVVNSTTSGLVPWVQEAEEYVAETEEKFNKLKNTIQLLGRQIMLDRFFVEQQLRTSGNSGIKQMRSQKDGTYNFHSATHSAGSIAAIHEHANNIRTVGMGEFEAVINGVEFRTRHNDYRLVMSHPTSSDYHATVPIEFPDVPPEVLGKATVDEEIAEMRKWFKAFHDQDYSIRDYRKYFKPVMCYMEAGWTKSTDQIEESFHSDRHFIDAKSWFDLQAKNMFTAASGSKSRLENLANLPTSIYGFTEDGDPKYAQWNYRILCNPLKKDLPTNRFRVVEDLSTRMRNQHNIFKHSRSRAARYMLNPQDLDEWEDRLSEAGLLDDIMGEIPGMDNHQGHIKSTDLDGNKMLNLDATEKDASRYHRWYRVDSKDAMGLQNVHRSFSDSFMFAAMTTQDKIVPVSTEKCNRNGKQCQTITQRWTYAIPLEIIYLTPLSKWNPYEIEYKGEDAQSEEYKSVNANGRQGGCDADGSKAFDGSHGKLYYITPAEFYSGEEVNSDAADTSRSNVCVLGKDKLPHKCRSSGTRIFLPNIKDVGVIRTRYPIMPIHGEGDAVWKELNALREYVMDETAQEKFKWDPTIRTSDNFEFELQPSVVGTPHIHTVVLTAHEYQELRSGKLITKTTSIANSHQHTLRLKWVNNAYLSYINCGDVTKAMCNDKHPKQLIMVENDEDVEAS